MYENTITPTEFDAIIKDQVEISQELLTQKRAEYFGGVDRLHNFRVVSALTGQPMREVLGGMMAKHTASLYDLLYSGTTHDKTLWDEKITDHINYLLILQAVLYEERSSIQTSADSTEDKDN